MRTAVVLYGPPAAGKDTIDAALADLSPDYRHFPRLKVGPGRTEGYRLTTADHLDHLRATGDLLWENHRYGATYAVDLSSLLLAVDTCTPVLHLGQPEGVETVTAATPSIRWTIVELWCTRHEAARRLAARGARDLTDRLTAWDATARLTGPGLRIDTERTEPDEAACIIHAAVVRSST